MPAPKSNPTAPEGAEAASGRIMVPTVGYDGLNKRRAIRASRAYVQRCGVSAKEIRSLRFSAKRVYYLRGRVQRPDDRPYLVVTATGPGALVGSIAKRLFLTVSYSYST